MEVCLTAHEDRADTAEQLAAVLSQFLDCITNSRDQEASSLWCVTPAEPMETSDVKWETTKSGEWTGNWSTEGDRDMMHTLNEDMGCDFKIENLAPVARDEPKRMMTPDELSCKSFAMASVSGRQTQTSQNSAPSDIESMSAVAAASSASGGSGREE